jgi:hypothetical protein
MQGNEDHVSLRLPAKVGSAGSRNADCLHGWRETNPTSASPKGFIAFVLHLSDAR